MKNIYILISILALTFLHSCNYLDVVPDERPTDAAAFSDARAAERYLYSCYSYLPDPRSGTEAIDLFTADEIVTSFEHETFASFPKGNYTSVSPVISYWNTLFQGIRQCYILLDNIDRVPNMDPEDKKVYAAEAKFLIAYYHYLLLKCYGPTLLITSTPDINMPAASYPARSSYDECVVWIADKFDDAVASGLKVRHTSTALGRGTSTAALAIKARMYLYAASPLFNGGKSSVANTDDLSGEYAQFVDESGLPLISIAYDASKWQRAADACLKAIQAAETTAGYSLYQNSTVTSEIPLPIDPVERKLRMTITDKNTPEIIWASTRKEGAYALQNKSAPFEDGYSYNGVAPTLAMLEFFYTENGLPIDEDPAYDYANRYSYGDQSNGMGVTLNLNMNREPRFYSWIAFHNSYYEVAKDNAYQKHVQFRQPDNCGIRTRSNNYSPTGYLNKKGVPPSYSRGKSGGNIVHYPWPIIRLGELYLNYAEALIEVGGAANIATAKGYIDKIRIRAGLLGVDATWTGTGVALDQNKMRQIVRQERTIELYLENQRFWDVRRWMLGTKYFNVKAKGMNITGTTDDAFFKVTDVSFVRKFLVPQHYLMPIPIADINNNPRIAQNPGY